MKIFKLIDFVISSSLIFICVLLCLLSATGDRTFVLVESYVVTGSWQVISMLVHECTRSFVRPYSGRRIYHIVVLILLLGIPVGSIFILLFAAPFMAAGYTLMCYKEWRFLQKRELIRLR